VNVEVAATGLQPLNFSVRDRATSPQVRLPKELPGPEGSPRNAHDRYPSRTSAATMIGCDLPNIDFSSVEAG
jgi:hypothetical protein